MKMLMGAVLLAAALAQEGGGKGRPGGGGEGEGRGRMPAAAGAACDLAAIEPGFYCADCGVVSERNEGKCKGCRKALKTVEVCVKRPGDGTILKALVVYQCVCGGNAPRPAELQHTAACDRKGVKRSCVRSGQHPHVAGPPAGKAPPRD